MAKQSSFYHGGQETKRIAGAGGILFSCFVLHQDLILWDTISTPHTFRMGLLPVNAVLEHSSVHIQMYVLLI